MRGHKEELKMRNEKTEFEMISISMKHAKEKVELSEALVRLESNKDFKKVFMNMYLKDYAVDLIISKTSVVAQNEKTQAYIQGQIEAIGYMIQYMRNIHQAGVVAADAIASDLEEQAQIIQEGVYDA